MCYKPFKVAVWPCKSLKQLLNSQYILVSWFHLLQESLNKTKLQNRGKKQTGDKHEFKISFKGCLMFSITTRLLQWAGGIIFLLSCVPWKTNTALTTRSVSSPDCSFQLYTWKYFTYKSALYRRIQCLNQS